MIHSGYMAMKSPSGEVKHLTPIIYKEKTGGGGGSGSALNDGVTSLTLTFEEDGELIEMSLPIIYKYFGDVDPGLDRLRLDMFDADATIPFFFILTMIGDEVDIPSLLNTFTDPSIFVDMYRRASKVYNVLIDVGDMSYFKLNSCHIYDRSDYPMFGENKIYIRYIVTDESCNLSKIITDIVFDKGTNKWGEWSQTVFDTASDKYLET